MKTPRRFLIMMGLAMGLQLSGSALRAHEGHDKTPGDTDTIVSGPVTISAEARKNLGLVSAEVEIRKIEKTLLVLGQIQAIPDRTVVISSRIAGRVTKLPVNDGETVRKGELVAEVESLQVGNPAPRAEYVSPIDGVVLSRDVFVGSGTDSNTKLLSVADLTEVYAQARVFEGQVNQISPGQRVRVRTEANPDEVFEGKIERIAGSLDLETHTVRVWARIANPDLKLRPHFQAVITVVAAEGDAVAAVPRSAVLGSAGSLFVFVEQDKNSLMFERRSVVTGISDDRFVEIIEGVVPGEKAVVTGNYQLQYVAPAKSSGKADHDDDVSPPTSERAPGRLQRVYSWALAIALIASIAVNVFLVRSRRFSSRKEIPSAEEGAAGPAAWSRPR